MGSLAQAIIDTAYNLSIKEEATKYRFAEMFLHAVKDKVNRDQAGDSLMHAVGMLKDVCLLAPDVKKAIRFTIDQNVADAIQKMNKTPEETILKALKFAEPPHNPTWIEFSLPGDSLRVGWLIKKQDDGMHIKYAQSFATTNHMPLYEDGAYHTVVTPDGFRMVNQRLVSLSPRRYEPEGPAGYVNRICVPALSALFLLNSRSKILKVEPPEDDFEKINRKRRKNGKEEKVSLNTIRFDIARVIRGGMSATEAAREMAAALVRGHFKVRQTGVFFWSPFVRSARNEEHKQEVYKMELGQERREVTASGPTMLPQ